MIFIRKRDRPAQFHSRQTIYIGTYIIVFTNVHQLNFELNFRIYN